jgi:hypothetical protein
MYLVYYEKRYDTSNGIRAESTVRQFSSFDDAKNHYDSLLRNKDIWGTSLYKSYDPDDTDYKEKFEELYDHVLKTTGIRESKTTKSI